MKRFAQFRGSLAAIESWFPSTKPVQVEATTPEAQHQSQLATSDVDEPDIEALFNYDDGSHAGVNVSAKTIKTEAGALPLSPLMDPTWRKAKQAKYKKKRKPPPTNVMGRFQKLMVQNPYGNIINFQQKALSPDTAMQRKCLRSL